MAADVLLYNALNETNRTLVTQEATLTANIATQNSLCTAAQNTINTNAPALVANAGPNQANIWCLIPTLPATGAAWTAGLKVCRCAGSSGWNYGSCCAWTVPAGVTCARFQLWGAGAGSGYGCCCAYTPFGGTGAYASVIMPVTAGDSYTICAGCAHNCNPSAGYSNVNGYQGCPSYVSGTGLTNFCAEGGESSLCCQIATRCICGLVQNSWCMFLGGRICNNNSVCWHDSIQGGGQGGTGSPACCFDNMFPMMSSCRTFYGSATNGTIYGIRGSYGSITVNCNGTIRVQHPPIYGFASSSCCCCIITSNYAGGCCYGAPQGVMQIPGAGGFANFKCGGHTSGSYGDRGKFGMVCVSYL